jgi:hypothetical protein
VTHTVLTAGTTSVWGGRDRGGPRKSRDARNTGACLSTRRGVRFRPAVRTVAVLRPRVRPGNSRASFRQRPRSRPTIGPTNRPLGRSGPGVLRITAPPWAVPPARRRRHRPALRGEPGRGSLRAYNPAPPLGGLALVGDPQLAGPSTARACRDLIYDSTRSESKTGTAVQERDVSESPGGVGMERS